MAVAGGTILDNFTMLMASQGPAWATGPEVIINEGVKSSYTWNRIAKGKSILEMAQGGDQITDTIFFGVKSTFTRYNPSAGRDFDQKQTGTTWTVNWAFATAYISWNKQSLGLNKSTHGKRYIAQRYKSYMFQLHQNLWTDVSNSVDDEFWKVPNQELMESSTPSDARTPYSFPVFINEQSDARNPTATAVTGLPDTAAGNGGWTTVMGINPGTQTKWQNQRGGYQFNGTSNTTGIFAAMKKLKRFCGFERLPKNAEYSDMYSTPHVILTQGDGVDNFEHALRVNQDQFRGVGKTSGQDPDYDAPMFGRIPMEWVEAMDTAAIYPTGSNSATPTLGTFDDTTNANNAGDIGYAGPRYTFTNCNYLNYVVHSENYCVMEEPIKLQGFIGTYAQEMDLWNNFIARSRMRHGQLYPTANVVNAAA